MKTVSDKLLWLYFSLKCLLIGSHYYFICLFLSSDNYYAYLLWAESTPTMFWTLSNAVGRRFLYRFRNKWILASGNLVGPTSLGYVYTRRPKMRMCVDHRRSPCGSTAHRKTLCWKVTVLSYINHHDFRILPWQKGYKPIFKMLDYLPESFQLLFF